MRDCNDTLTDFITYYGLWSFLVHLDDTETHLPKRNLPNRVDVRSFEVSPEQIIFDDDETSRSIPQIEKMMFLNPPGTYVICTL